ncbi:MAG: ROK family protein [Chthoniobacter sp.]|nr:ROK family protein [Chthoniobacter sp.]
MTSAVGLDLGGTQIKGVVITSAGEILRREMRATNDGGTDSLAWAGVAKELADELGGVLPVGLSAPGLAARDRRSIALLPGRLRGIEGLDWTEFLGRARPVPVANDAHSALAGEAWLGSARGLQNAVLLTLGTGVGGAILSEGKILRGHLGRAGHLGHTCLDVHGPPSIVGTPGALEDFIGNHNIAARTDGRFATTHALIAASQAGDAEATRVWLDSVHALACAIASFINILDPEAVIIGGGIAQADDALFDPLRAELARIEWRPAGHTVKLLPAALGEWAGALGAARAALLAGGETGNL